MELVQWLLPKIKSQKMQSYHTLSPQCISHTENSSDFRDDEPSVFEKYKAGCIPLSSAFRLYSTDVSCEEDSQSSDQSPLKIRGSYRKYTLEEKEMAVAKILNGHDVKEVSKEYGIPRRNLLRWRKNGCERKEGGGRPTDFQMERVLYEKIQRKEIKGQKEIRAAAIRVSSSQNFKASKGWFSKFCRRYKAQTGQDLLKA